MLFVSSWWSCLHSHAHLALLQRRALPALPSQLFPCLAVSQSAKMIQVMTLQDYRLTETKRESRRQRGNYTWRRKLEWGLCICLYYPCHLRHAQNRRIIDYSKLEGTHKDHWSLISGPTQDRPMNHIRSGLWNLFLAGTPAVLRATPCPIPAQKW